MIITADWLIPGDGRTVLERQAVALSEKDGQILEYGPVDALERKYGVKRRRTMAVVQFCRA